MLKSIDIPGKSKESTHLRMDSYNSLILWACIQHSRNGSQADEPILLKPASLYFILMRLDFLFFNAIMNTVKTVLYNRAQNSMLNKYILKNTQTVFN